MRNADIRFEMMDRLGAYLQGREGLADLLGWEAELSLSAWIAKPLRADLDRIALMGEEVESGLRDEREVREVARSVLDGLAARARAS
ncbi:MAG: hypothetical protein K1X87_08550 [Dehalococcoidia bacterium]|nr:hypothetical protein [Dehalococcoidia bacterium]HRC63126.1 hypothetical protein [Dehalococcoidia bacterium]